MRRRASAAHREFVDPTGTDPGTEPNLSVERPSTPLLAVPLPSLRPFVKGDERYEAEVGVPIATASVGTAGRSGFWSG
jgi:hypothetical protein